ncbi:hypothetical protein ACOSP7_028603 [Xanthoceras sorbifolium]
MEAAEQANDRVCNAIVKAHHDLMVQYKASRVDEWKPDEWIVYYKKLIGEVDVEEAASIEFEPDEK